MLLLRGGAAAAAMAKGSGAAERSRVVVITGPTGVGKSAVALALARRLGGEIISADSVQVYRGLNVGSAKTPATERQDVPHHLLDMIEPTEEYSVGNFFGDARSATEAVLARRRVPIVVGGTGLYLLWYMNGKPDTPKATEEQARAVETELKESGGKWDAALKHLADAGDTETARTLACNDWYRLRRALEILKVTGKPRTSFPLPWVTSKEPLLSNETESQTGPVRVSLKADLQALDYDFRPYFLYMKRSDLYRHLDLRCERMLTDTQGLLQEASWLLDLGILPNSWPPSRAIGYRQTMEYLAASRSAGGTSTVAEFLAFLAGFQKASRNYAKRQNTWFRDEGSFRWLDATLPTEDIVDRLQIDYHSPPGILEPSAWEIKQKSAEVMEVKELKTYVTENRIFTEIDACSNILDWVKKTQKQSSRMSCKGLIVIDCKKYMIVVFRVMRRCCCSTHPHDTCR